MCAHTHTHSCERFIPPLPCPLVPCSVSDVARWSEPKVHRQYVMQPVQGQAQLMWALWKKSSRIKVPTLSVTGDMDKLQVRTCEARVLCSEVLSV